MKIRDLKGDESLYMKKIRTPTGVVGYYKSQWGYRDGKAGVWLSTGNDGVIYPQFINKLEDILDWEVTNDDVNCDKLTDMKYIDLTIG